MSGKPLVIRPTRLETSIPEDLRAQMDLVLYSEVEQRVPKGAYQRFICDRLREYFSGNLCPLTPAERRMLISALDAFVACGAANRYHIDGSPDWLSAAAQVATLVLSLRKKLS